MVTSQLVFVVNTILLTTNDFVTRERILIHRMGSASYDCSASNGKFLSNDFPLPFVALHRFSISCFAARIKTRGALFVLVPKGECSCVWHRKKVIRSGRHSTLLRETKDPMCEKRTRLLPLILSIEPVMMFDTKLVFVQLSNELMGPYKVRP